MSNFISGRHFLQTPGPTNLPDRVLSAMDRNAINHRGPQFGALGRDIVAKLRTVFQTRAATIAIFPASGTGAWESAMTNTLSPADRILISRTGQFSHLWEQMALRFDLDVLTLETDWRRGADPAAIGHVLKPDREHRIKAVCVVHSETSTSCMTDVAAVRHAVNRAAHPALLMVDAISSLGCADYRQDEWGVDVTIAGSQKGLMVPPGLAFTAISEKALAAARAGGSRRSYWDWEPLVTANRTGFFPYTPAVNLLFALDEALDMLVEEGLPTVFARHERYAQATRLAVAGGVSELQCPTRRLCAGSHRRPHAGRPQRRQPPQCHPGQIQHEHRQRSRRRSRTGCSASATWATSASLSLTGALTGVEMGLRAPASRQAGGVQAAMNFLARQRVRVPSCHGSAWLGQPRAAARRMVKSSVTGRLTGTT